MGLDELLHQNHFSTKLEEREQRINLLIQEIEELKSIHQSTFNNYDELRKTNYQLQLKIEERRYSMGETKKYREMCRKLELEKKDAVWRE